MSTHILPANAIRPAEDADRLRWPGGRCPTRRELQITTLVAHGLSDADIGATLGLSVSTVKTHLHRLLVRAGARTRAHLVAVAYIAGVLHTPAADRAAVMAAQVRQARAGLRRIAEVCGFPAPDNVIPMQHLLGHALATVHMNAMPHGTATVLDDGPGADRATATFEAVEDALAEIGAAPAVRAAVLGTVLDATGIPPGLAETYRHDPTVSALIGTRTEVADRG